MPNDNKVPLKEWSSSIRKTISIPAELAAKIAKHPEVNWSKVAAKAFEEALNKLK